MVYFGDESGDFRSLLNGSERCIAHAVVGGDNIDVLACSKRAVRNVTDLEEAKWNDLRRTEKRRFIECLEERDGDLRMGVATIDRDNILSLYGHYQLHQDSLRYINSIMYAGIAYGTLLSALDVRNDSRPRFKFDRLYNKSQSAKVIDVLTNRCGSIECSSHDSRHIQGIQTADCIAGAAREDYCKGSTWFESLNESMYVDATNHVLSSLEKHLHDVSTGP